MIQLAHVQSNIGQRYFIITKQQEAANKTLQQQPNSKKIKTAIEKMTIFYDAEEYHQNFLAKQEMGYSK